MVRCESWAKDAAKYGCLCLRMSAMRSFITWSVDLKSTTDRVFLRNIAPFRPFVTGALLLEWLNAL